MKSFVVVLALVALAAADVSHLARGSEADAPIISQDSDVGPEQYSYGYQTGNGISGREVGALKSYGQESAINVQGENSYTSPEGQQISLTYTADENGYHPQGAHLPVAPEPQPIPEYILRSLEYIRTHPQPEVVPGRRI